MAEFDRTRIRALCFDVDGTLADTDDRIVAHLATLMDALPGISGRRAERLARRVVMASESPVHAAYAKLDAFGLDAPLYALQRRLRGIKKRGADPAHTRNLEAIDEVPHEMISGVREMIVRLAPHFPMCTISTGSAPRIERFLEHYEVREYFSAVIGAQTTRRMKPHPEPLLHAAATMGVSPAQCLMIGDTTIDVRTGVAAGAQTVAVLCGFGTRGELVRAGANIVLRTTSDLLPVLRPADDSLNKTASPTP